MILSKIPTAAIPAPKLISRAQFDKMTTRQKRVAIAKDVIYRIKIGLLGVAGGCTLSTRFSEDSSCTEVQDKINTERCVGCAKGAMALAWIGNFDSVGGSMMACTDVTKRYSFPLELIEVFSWRMMNCIEVAFEGEEYYWCHEGVEPYDLDSAIHTFMGEGDRGSKARALAIFKNIVKNEGVLVLETFEGNTIEVG